MRLPQLFGHAPGQADDVCFGGIVPGHVGAAGQQTRRGRHIEHGAEALCLHLLHGKLEQPVQGEDVYLCHGQLPLRIRLEKAAADAETGIVDEDVDPLAVQCGAEAVEFGLLREIRRQDAADGVVLGQQLGGEGFQPVFAPGGEDEPEPQLCVPPGELLPDARACAGDPYRFVCHNRFHPFGSFVAARITQFGLRCNFFIRFALIYIYLFL